MVDCLTQWYQTSVIGVVSVPRCTDFLVVPSNLVAGVLDEDEKMGSVFK